MPTNPESTLDHDRKARAMAHEIESGHAPVRLRDDLKTTAMVVSLVLASCHASPEWSGWVYPDGDETHIDIGHFFTYEDCETAAHERMQSLDSPGDATFLCSYQCRWNERAQTEICQTDRN